MQATFDPIHVSRPRLPGLIAGELRQQIVAGDLSEGARLPKEEILRERFGVGRPVMREAMRILESEGLVSIVRGNQGGAIIREPGPDHTAYALSLLLSSRGVKTRDVGSALKELEPACAALCARRPDRHTAVVPPLRKVHDASRKVLGDPIAASALFRRFHETIVARCGNQTMIVLIGALETIWSENVRLATAKSSTPRPSEELAKSFDEHQRLLDHIVAGDALGAKLAAAEHMARVQAATTRANRDNRIVLLGQPDGVRRRHEAPKKTRRVEN